jgi:hypothetical protein
VPQSVTRGRLSTLSTIVLFRTEIFRNPLPGELELRHLERDSHGDNEQKRCAHHRQRHRGDVQPIPI